MQKLKKVQRYAKISDTLFDQRSLIHWEAWFPPCFARENQKNTNFFCTAILHPLLVKVFKYETLRPLLFNFSQEFRISKKFGHLTLGSGGKKTFKQYLKSEQTDLQTDLRPDGHTDKQIDIQTEQAQRADSVKITSAQTSKVCYTYISAMQFSLVQHRRRCNVVKYITVWYRAVQYSAVQCSAVLGNSVQRRGEQE